MGRRFFAAGIIGVLLSSISFGATYGGGAGTSADPYQIWTPAQMNTIGANSADWGKCFKLMADIDMSAYTGTQYNIIGNITTPFTGFFDGNGHIISNLTYVSTIADECVGVFGKIDNATIQNLGVENVNIIGRLHVGGLVGYKFYGSIIACYTTGSVTGTGYVGGLAGGNGGTIIACYTTCSVTGTNYYVGGLVGSTFDSSIATCYATGSVTSGPGTDNYVGGLIGYKSNDDGSIVSCFWDVQTSGQTRSQGGIGKTTAQMKILTTFTDAGWDFVYESANGLNDYWQMAINDYPHLTHHAWTLTGDGTSANPYIVANTIDLGRVWLRPSACYRLRGNLDLTGILWSSAVIPVFTGVFDGQGFVISHLTINQPGLDRISLFGWVITGQIRNLGIENANITGYRYVGGLVGYSFYSSIITCYTTGLVSGTNRTYSGIGGLVGFSEYGSITACYSTSSVTGYQWVGGLVGYNYYGPITTCYATGSINSYSFAGGLVGANWGTVTSCYATGTVIGVYKRYIGGLVGKNYLLYSYLINSCFWDTQTSGMTIGESSGFFIGVIGKTTAEMQTLSTFTDAGWDFIDTWYMNGYPHLQMEMEASGSQDGLIPLGFTTIQKARIGRTTFEYELAVIVRNSNSFDMTNVQMQLKDWDAAVLSVSDDSITIDAIPAGATVTSTDTFKIIVDRSTLINSSKLAWILTYYVPAYGIQQATLSMSMSGIDLVPGDITGDSKVNLEDFVIMAQQWDDMPGDPSADIALPPDGHVGIEDLIYLAENWLN